MTSKGDALLLPNLLIAGVRKGGTTSLFHYLAQHPGICPATVKSINHYTPMVYGEPVTASMSDYARHFRAWAGEPWRLEASPTYFPGGAPLIEAVRRDLADVRVIIVLREPVARFWSGYTYRRSKGFLPADLTFEAILETCLRLHRQGQAASLRVEALNGLPEYSVYRALSTGVYVKYLKPWADAFGDRLRVVFFEDLIRDPGATVAEICDWLGLDVNIEEFDFSARNKTGQPRNMALRRAAGRVNDLLAPIIRERPRLKSAVKSVYDRVNSRTDAAEVFSPEARAKVRDFYQPSVAQLAVMLADRGVGPMPPWLAPAGQERR